MSFAGINQCIQVSSVILNNIWLTSTVNFSVLLFQCVKEICLKRALKAFLFLTKIKIKVLIKPKIFTENKVNLFCLLYTDI